MHVTAQKLFFPLLVVHNPWDKTISDFISLDNRLRNQTYAHILFYFLYPSLAQFFLIRLDLLLQHFLQLFFVARETHEALWPSLNLASALNSEGRLRQVTQLPRGKYGDHDGYLPYCNDCIKRVHTTHAQRAIESIPVPQLSIIPRIRSI